MSDRWLGLVTTRRALTVLAGVAIVVLGHEVGGYGGAAVVGSGIGVAIVGVGKREPHLLRRRRADADHDDAWPTEAREPGRSEW